MNRKDELETLIKELSEKQQSYQVTETDEVDNVKTVEFTELIPVDLDLSKKLFSDLPEVEEPETAVTIEKITLFSKIKSFFPNLVLKLKNNNFIQKLSSFVKHKPGMFLLILASLLTIISFGTFAAGCSIFNNDAKAVAKTLSTLNKEENTGLIGSDRINILVLGIDSPDGKFNARSDTIVLVSLDPKTQTISALSIPRDTYVNIAGHGKDKINAANELGGYDLTVKTVSDLLGVQIDHYAITNFSGFMKIIDTLGGVDLDVEKDMHYRTYNGMIDLKKGYQHLNGNKALQYVRFRHDALGDISRTQRQQKFMLALASEFMKPQTLLKLPTLLPEISSAVKTDLSFRDILALASTIKSFDLKRINTQTLPGNFINIKGISYWYVEADKAKQVILDVFVGKTSDAVVNPDLRPGFADTQVKTSKSPSPKINPIKPSVNTNTYKEIPAKISVPENTYNENNNTPIPSTNSTTIDSSYPNNNDTPTQILPPSSSPDTTTTEQVYN